MKTALDTSVILDVVTADRRWADASAAVIRESLVRGHLIIGECVLAEIAPAFEPADLHLFLADWRIEFVPSNLDGAMRAGQMFRSYLERGGKPKRVIPDFLIGAHALSHADRLLARDRGFYRDYFSDLTVIDPAQ